MKVGLNGSVVKADEAVISVYDHGFLYGMGLFETFRTYGRKPYLLDRHWARLQSGCRELGIRFEMSQAEIEAWTLALLDANGLADGYVRLTVSAGVGELGLPAGDYARPTALLMVKPLPEVEEETLLRGRELKLLRTRRNTPEGMVRFKSLHYMNNILAKRELGGLTNGIPLQPGAPGGAPSGAGTNEGIAASSAADHATAASSAADHATARAGESRDPRPSGMEGLMLSENGWLAEGIVSNLFFVSGDVVHTPSIGTGILPGVTRERVLELAAQAGYRTEEGYYRWDHLLKAQEVWLTNSIQEIVPVTLLTDENGIRTPVGLGAAGPIAKRLLELYRLDTLV